MLKNEFINKIAPYAVEDMRKTRIPASLTIAQAILESGWGESGLTKKANNLFGIKSTPSWRGKVYTANTKENYGNGSNFVDIVASFKAYDSWGDSIADHSQLLSSKRYRKLIDCKDYKLACKYVKEAGYATDPDYASKLIKIIEQNKLYEYDIEKYEMSVEKAKKIIMKCAGLDQNTMNYLECYKYGKELLLKLANAML